MRRFWLRSATVTALAMAERSAFSMSRAMAFLVKRRMESASAAFLPRISSSTSPAFWAEERMYLSVALTSSMPASLRLGSRRRARARARARGLGHLLHLGGVALERAGGRELAQLVADHVLGDVHGNELAAVVD